MMAPITYHYALGKLRLILFPYQKKFRFSSITTKVAEFSLKEHINTKYSVEKFKVNLKKLVDYMVVIDTKFNINQLILYIK